MEKEDIIELCELIFSKFLFISEILKIKSKL